MIRCVKKRDKSRGISQSLDNWRVPHTETGLTQGGASLRTEIKPEGEEDEKGERGRGIVKTTNINYTNV